jgi:hypothetical protein
MLLFKRTCGSTDIFASEDLVEFLTHCGDKATRLVFRALLLKVVDYVDVDRFTVGVNDNLIERLEHDIPHQKSIARVLTVMPVDGERFQVGDGADELTGECATELEYSGTYFRFKLVGMSLKPLSIPDKRNCCITDVMDRRMGCDLQSVQDCLKELDMAKTLGRVDLQHHFVVDAGVSLIFDLARHKEQGLGWRTGVEFDHW